MASIGLRYLTYARYKESEDPSTGEVTVTYNGRRSVGRSISADLNINNTSNTLYDEDGPDENVSEFADAQLSIGAKQLDYQTQEDFYGHKHTPAEPGEGVSRGKPARSMANTGDASGYVGLAFYTPMFKNNSGGKRSYEVFFLNKIGFGEPSLSFKTKEREITFTTPTTVGTVLANPYGDWKHQASFDYASDAKDYIDKIFENIKPADYTLPELPELSEADAAIAPLSGETSVPPSQAAGAAALSEVDAAIAPLSGETSVPPSQAAGAAAPSEAESNDATYSGSKKK